jgi:hypothetical protein
MWNAMRKDKVGENLEVFVIRTTTMRIIYYGIISVYRFCLIKM